MRVTLPDGPASAGVARRAVRDACAGREVDLDDAVLCTSELVSNAVLHGAPPVVLETELQPAGVRISVHDAGGGSPARRPRYTEDTLSGRGLDIVEALSSRWGTGHTAHGTVTWFELVGARAG